MVSLFTRKGSSRAFSFIRTSPHRFPATSLVCVEHDGGLDKCFVEDQPSLYYTCSTMVEIIYLHQTSLRVSGIVQRIPIPPVSFKNYDHYTRLVIKVEQLYNFRYRCTPRELYSPIRPATFPLKPSDWR